MEQQPNHSHKEEMQKTWRFMSGLLQEVKQVAKQVLQHIANNMKADTSMTRAELNSSEYKMMIDELMSLVTIYWGQIAQAKNKGWQSLVDKFSDEGQGINAYLAKYRLCY